MPQLELQRKGTTGWGVFQDRYQQPIETEEGTRGETYEEAFDRVAEFAVVDDSDHPWDKERQHSIFYDLLSSLKFCPGGRILSNCGRAGNNNPANCFVLPIADSKESIFDQLKNMAFIESYGGGVGINFSTLRPAGSPLKSKNGGYASGPCTFMDVYDAAIHTISQGGSRRGAFIAVLEVWHPDIQKFIHAKEKDETRWTGMNVSVGITDKFMLAVHADEDWDLTWNGEVVKTVKAKDLWNEICEAAHNSGDPGLLYIDRLNDPNKHPYYYARHIRATNPCVPRHYNIMDSGRMREICDPRAEEWHSWDTGKKSIATVYLANGMRFTCTPDHRIMLDDYNFCPAKDLEGKMVMGPNFKNWRGETEIIKNEVIRGIMLDTTDIVHENGESYLDAYLDKDRHIESAKWLYSAGFEYKETKGRKLVLRAPRRKITNLLDDAFLRFPRNNRRIPKDIRFGEASRVRSFLLGFFSTTLKVTTTNMRRSFVLESVNEPRLAQTQLLLSTFGINSKKSETKMSVVKKGLNKKVVPGKTKLAISPGNTTLVKERIGVLNPYHDEGTGGRKVSDTKGIKVERVEIYPAAHLPVMDFEMHDTQEPYNWVNGLVVHNCGELPLAPYGACCLGSMVLPNFVVEGEDGTQRFDFGTFKKYVRRAVVFLDNIITNGEFPLEENRKEMDAIRPIGLGFFGLADTFLLLGYKYGSEDSLEFLEEVLRVMKDAALESSAFLAKLLGAFPEYNEDKDRVCFSNGMKCPPRRNGSVLSFAPTGSIVLLYGASWGIEPYYAVSMVRNERMGKMNSTYSLLSKWIEEHDGELPEHLSVVKDPDGVVTELTVDDHLNVLATVAKWSDNAVSKCVAKGTLVATNHGIMPIESLGGACNAGEFAEAREGLKVIDQFGKPQRVTAHYCDGEKPTKKVHFAGGLTIEASLTHRFMTPCGWKKTESLSPGDWVLVRDNGFSYTEGGQALPELGTLTPSSNAITVPSFMSEDLARWLGMVVADGSLIESSGAVQLHTSNKKVGETFIRLSESVFGTVPKKFQDKRNDVMSYGITSRALVRWVKSLVGSRAVDKHIPVSIMCGSEKEQRAFIWGVSLDGYYKSRRKKLCVYYGKSKQLATQLFAITQNLGLKPRFRSRYVEFHGYHIHGVIIGEPVEVLEVKKGKPLSAYAEFTVVPDHVHGTPVPYKHKHYRAWLAIRNRGATIAKRKTLEGLGCELDPQLRATKVTCVEDSTSQVFDLEVEGNHSYLISGLISHNTVNEPKDATPELSKYVYDKTWQLGVKGCTIYREESKSESAVTAVGSQSSPDDLEFDPEVEEIDCDDLEIYDLTSSPRERQLYLDGTTYQLKYSPNSPNLYITINDSGDGPHEVFFVIDDEEKQELLRVVGKLLTSLYRRGHLVTHLINELKGYESATGGGWLDGKYIASLTAGIGMILEKHYKRMGYISDVDRVPFITEDEKAKVKGMKGDKCPECNEYTVFPQDGCAVCFNCGHSKCGGVN